MRDRERKELKQADRPDSVTADCSAMTAIPLGRELLHGSSFLPARSASNINACLFGIAPDGGYRVSPFVTQARNFRCAQVPKTRLCGPIPRLIPCGFRRTVVNRHPALWSPDLPPACTSAGRRLSGLLQPTFYPVSADATGLVCGTVHRTKSCVSS